MAVIRVPGRGDVELGDMIGSGAEGQIFAVKGSEDVCVKLLFDDDPVLYDRIQALTRLQPARWRGDHGEHHHVAWPLAWVESQDRRPRGYVMPRVQGSLLEVMFDARSRLDALAEPTWRTALDVAARTARLFQMVHDVDIVLGDVSAANLMVTRSGHISLIDCDTVQFRDPGTGGLWPATKLTPEYAPPNSRTDGGELSSSHDLFGLGILIARLLMEGQHPFEGVPARGADLTIDQNIARRNNRITHPEQLVPIAWAFDPAALPPAITALLIRCFGPGYDDPEARPSPAQWQGALDRAGYELQGCVTSDRHLFHSSLPSCVWCGRREIGHGDSYPPSTARAGAPRVPGTAGTVPAPSWVPPVPLAPPVSTPMVPGPTGPAPSRAPAGAGARPGCRRPASGGVTAVPPPVSGQRRPVGGVKALLAVTAVVAALIFIAMMVAR